MNSKLNVRLFRSLAVLYVSGDGIDDSFWNEVLYVLDWNILDLCLGLDF